MLVSVYTCVCVWIKVTCVCLHACTYGCNETVDFPDRPAKMLAAAIADYGPASLLRVQLCDLPRLPLGKLKSTEACV